MVDRKLPFITQESVEALSPDKSKELFEIQEEYVAGEARKSRNELIEQLQALHGKKATIDNLVEYRRLKDSARKEIAFAKRLNDPEEIIESNNEWYRQEKKIIGQAGPHAGRRLNQLEQLRQTVNAQGIRIGHSKIRKRALEDLSVSVNEFSQDIVSDAGGITKGLDRRQELLAKINTYEAKGILNKDTAEAFRKSYSRATAGAILKRSLQENELVQARDGIFKAKEHYDKLNELLEPLNKDLNAQEKKMWLIRKKTLQPKGVSRAAEYGDVFNNVQQNLLSGRSSYKELNASAKKLKSALQSDLNSGNLTAKGAATRRKNIRTLNIQLKFWEKLREDSDQLQNKSLAEVNPVILDFSKSTAEVANRLGLSTGDESLAILSALRKEFVTNLYVKGDPKQTAINQYNFLANLGGKDKPLLRPEPDPSDNPIDILRKNARYEKALTGVVGVGGLTKSTADLFDKLQEQENPQDQEELGSLVSENPQLLENVAKARSKPENRILSSSTKEFINKNNNVLGITNSEVKALTVDIRNNPRARKAFDDVFAYTNIKYGEELRTTAQLANEDLNSIISGLAIATYRDLLASGESNSLIASGINGDSGNLIEKADQIITGYKTNLEANRTLKGQAVIYNDHTLAKDTDASNLVVGAFSDRVGLGVVGSTVDFLGRSIDIGTRDVRPLDKVGQVRLETFIKMKTGTNINLRGRLRLIHENGTIYRIGYQDKFGSSITLKDELGSKILLDSKLIDTNKKIAKNKEADYVIDLIRRSNVHSDLDEE